MTIESRFGPYGGRYVPETLIPALDELERGFAAACHDKAFMGAFRGLLADFVGRPTPLTHAAKLSKQLDRRVYLKREDLCHTGAHKINNALGQVLLAKKMGKRVTAPANPSPAATPAVAFDPEPELRVLREAREDLRAGRPERAYRRLDEYGRQNGAGMLTQERKALSAIALCRWQPGPEALARASEFLRNSPDSPLAKRVRSTCEKTGKSSE